MGLKTKFNLVLVAAFLVGLVLAAVLCYPYVNGNARREVIEQATLMERQAATIGTYTDQEVAPLLQPLMDTRFLPQSIPFFAVQTNFKKLSAEYPDYSLRQTALNPTNLADRPTDWQADIIDLFRRNPKLTSWTSERESADGRILSVSRPIVVSDQGCLTCHSVPAAAPASMVGLYGANNGFGWKLGETVGAQIVSVPMRVALDRATNTFFVIMGGLLSVFLLTMLIMNLLLHFVIVRPVQAISAAANAVSMGQLEAPELAVKGKDEIASLSQSFNRMRRSLVSALKMLEE